MKIPRSKNILAILKSTFIHPITQLQKLADEYIQTPSSAVKIIFNHAKLQHPISNRAQIFCYKYMKFMLLIVFLPFYKLKRAQKAFSQPRL